MKLYVGMKFVGLMMRELWILYGAVEICAHLHLGFLRAAWAHRTWKSFSSGLKETDTAWPVAFRDL